MTYLKKIAFFFLLAIGFLACESNSKAVEKDAEPAENETSTSYTTHNVPWSEIQRFGKIPYDFLVPYGNEELQFGELRTPISQDTFPLVILIHGGCWLSSFNLDHASAIATDLVKDGYAVWTPEYRRVGNEGGGYPNTFLDVQASINFARKLAEIYPLDIENVVLMGHSAGGHLALWYASLQNLAKESLFYEPNPLPLKGVISLAGITDLVAYDKLDNNCSSSVSQLMGGKLADRRAAYQQGNPIELVPTNTPIRLVHGTLDNIVPLNQSKIYSEKANAAGDDAKVLSIEGGGHFDMVSPYSAAWNVIKTELKKLITE